MEWMILPYKRYADFSGRSRRMEYWMFQLLFWIVMVGLAFVGGGMEMLIAPDMDSAASGAGMSIAMIVLAVFFLGSLIPAIAVGVRRFHDAGFSGWVYLGLALASAIPLIGILFSLAMLVMLFLPSAPANKWGENPKDDDGSYYNYEDSLEGQGGVNYR